MPDDLTDLVSTLAGLLERSTSNSMNPSTRRRWMADQEVALLRTQVALSTPMPAQEDVPDGG